MGKTPEDLEKSRKKREFVIQQFGEVPTSVWPVDYSWGKSTLEFDERKQQKVAEEKHLKKMKYNLKTFETQDGKTVQFNEIQDAFSMSSQNVRGKGAGLSTFPPDLCRKIVIFYSEEGETILDPCAGHASRLETVYKLNRNYIGYDVCHEFCLFNERVKAKLLENQLFPSKYTITLHEQSSEKMVEESNSVALVMTSPPYWCHLPGTEIITKNGMVLIENLKKSDYVYTHKTRYKPVLGVSSRFVKEPIVLINTWGNQNQIKLTKNHKLYVVKKKLCPYFIKHKQNCKPECAYLRCGTNIKHKCIEAYKQYSPVWIKARKLEKGDFLIYPINKIVNDIKTIKISNYVTNLKVIKNQVILNNNQYGNSSMSNIIPINDDFIRLCGYYLAEGSCGDESCITFSFHKKEINFINDVKKLFKNLWNIKGKVYIQGNAAHLKFYKTPLCSLFKILFGEYSYELHIPEFLMLLPEKKQMLLVETYYYGDGCKVRKSGYDFTSTSGILIEQIKQILLRNNIIAGTFKTDKSKDRMFIGRQLIKKRHIVYGLSFTAMTELEKFKLFIQYKRLRKKANKIQIGKPYAFIFKDHLYLPIRKISTKQYSGKVYNCEVADDNSFMLSNCASHNCIEYYDDNPAQLGYHHTYEEFLAGITRVLSECYRVLKPDKFCVFNVNDFRKEGKYYMYHAHIARIMEKVGFKLHDIIIIPWQSCIGACFADQIWSRKVTAKKHEYLIVGKKLAT